MRRTLVVCGLVWLAGCGSKTDGGAASGSGAGTGSADPKLVEAPINCPAGNVVKDGACVVAVTPEKVQAVAQQQTKLDELAKLLDKVDTVAAPIEILNAFRQQPEWKNLTAKFEKLKMLDEVVALLDNSAKTLRTFKAGLGEASGRLGNLKVELDRLLVGTGAAKKIEEVQAQVSSQVRSALEPLAAQVTDTIVNALTPLASKLDEVKALLDVTCGTVTLSGGGSGSKELCKQAQTAFANASTYIADFKERPAKLFDEVSNELETQLSLLIDTQSQQLIDAAQTKVNQALNLPPGGGSAGSAAPAGSAAK